MSRDIKILVEEHPDGFVAYPLGVEGTVLGQGDTAEEAIADARSALEAHVAAFGTGVLSGDGLLQAYVLDDAIEIG